MSAEIYSYSLYTPNNGRYFHANYLGTASVPNYLYLNYQVTDVNLYSQYCQNLANSSFSPDSINLFPMATRYFSPAENVYVIERPPFQIDLDFSTKRSYEPRKSFKVLESTKLWIPWTVSVINVNNTSHDSFTFDLYFNDKPVTSIDEILIQSWLPNTSSSRVCLGQDTLKIQQLLQQGSSITDIYNVMFNSFFAGWNSDLSPIFVYTDYIAEFTKKISTNKKAPKDISSPPHYWTKSNSNYLKNILYTLSHMTLEEIFQYIQSVKQKYSSSQTTHSTFSSVITRASNQKDYILSTEDVITPYLYSYLNALNTSSFSISQFPDFVDAKFQIAIENFSDSFDYRLFINNPFIISQIFKRSRDTIFNSDQNIALQIMNFDFSQVVQYNLQPNLEVANANAN